MIELIKTNYIYPRKPCLDSTADLLLYPTRKALNGKQVVIDYQNKNLTTIETEVNYNAIFGIFFRVICGLVAILIAPLTLAACLIKIYSAKNEKLHEQFLKREKREAPSVITPSFPTPTNSTTCSICTDDFKESKKPTLTMKKCHDVFHTQCINAWLKKNNSCPNCLVEAPLELEMDELIGHNRQVEQWIDSVNKMGLILRVGFYDSEMTQSQKEQLLKLLEEGRFDTLKIKKTNDARKDRADSLRKLKFYFEELFTSLEEGDQSKINGGLQTFATQVRTFVC